MPCATIGGFAPTIRVLDATSLGDTVLATWAAIQKASPDLHSPFLSPGFTRLMARCKGGVYVAVFESEDGACGFFPYEDDGTGRGVAVGYGDSDYQGLVTRAGLRWTARQLLDATGLESLTFDHLICGQADCMLPEGRSEHSFIIDITNGYDIYAAQLKAELRHQLVQANRKRRALERDMGPVVFEIHTWEPALLDQLLAWKEAQWARSGHPGRFSEPWERALMMHLTATDEPGSGGFSASCAPEAASPQRTWACVRKTSGITGCPPTTRPSPNILPASSFLTRCFARRPAWACECSIWERRTSPTSVA